VPELSYRPESSTLSLKSAMRRQLTVSSRRKSITMVYESFGTTPVVGDSETPLPAGQVSTSSDTPLTVSVAKALEPGPTSARAGAVPTLLARLFWNR
jgi:hypothetical protein